VIVTLVGVIIRLPEVRARARHLNAEAGQLEWQTLRDEITRLQEKVTAQDQRIAELEQADESRREREAELEQENRSLKAKVTRLETRIRAMEEIFRIGPLPPEMQAELDKLKKIE
jgi:peptidoglycan hydrolase CwlO-like protein